MRLAVALQASCTTFVLLAVACGQGPATEAVTPGTSPGGKTPGSNPSPTSPSSPSSPSSPKTPAPSPGTPAKPPAAPSCSGLAAQPLDATWTLEYGGVQRTFYVHVPASYHPTAAIPVVLDFHGFTSDAIQEELLTGMVQKADEEGFVTVHAEGLGVPQSWNAGACCGYAATANIDDVGFVSAMIDQLEAKICVDTHRVFATGMSNGGFLSHRLGCELSARIAAIAPVAGVLGIPTCKPTRPVPIMEFHGTLDPLVPYDGDPVLGFPSVPDTFQGWATRDGCTGKAVSTYKKGDSSCQTYETCKAGAEVTLCTVQGGGHTWPGGLPVPTLGYTTTDLSATDAMWTFFKAHPMP